MKAVYLFGSVAMGTAQPDSDIDLAVLVRDESALPSLKLDLLGELVRAGCDRVDMFMLNTADLVTRHEAVRLNDLVYEADDFERGSYYSRVVRQYLDFLPYLERQRKAYKRRMQHDSEGSS